MARRSLRKDIAAAFPVFEAILVAVLVFTAVLFFTSVQRPSVSKEQLGIDLGRIASDTLDILESRTFDDPDGGDKLALDDWINRTLSGDTDVADSVDSLMRDVLPSGTRYTMRLETGSGTHHLLPPGDPPTPRNGRAAESFLMPDWTAFENRTRLPTLDVVTPGGSMDGAGLDPGDPAACGSLTWTSLTAPTNWTRGPDGQAWEAWWCENQPDPAPDPDLEWFVPDSALHGTWNYTAPGACVSGCLFHVGLPGAATDHPVYGLQLVVWFGA